MTIGEFDQPARRGTRVTTSGSTVRAAQLEDQIARLSEVLRHEHGGPDRSESAVDMAVRLLRQQDMRIAGLEHENRNLLRTLRRIAQLVAEEAG